MTDQQTNIEESFQKVLIADDNKLSLKSTGKMLELFGYQVSLAENGDQAFESYMQFKPDIILMDIEMPVADGLQTVMAIRKIEKKEKKHTPIIAVTNYSAKNDRNRYFEAGFDDYLSKPFKPFELGQILKKIKENNKEND